MKGAFDMKAKRWTLGIVLAAAVSLFGLIQADASPFASQVLSDDLGNRVNGEVAEASEWTSDADGGSDSSSNGNGNGGGSKGNNGHGNNEDGVDSSNKGKSKEDLDSDPTIDDEKR